MPSYAQRFFLGNTKQATPALPAQVYDLLEAGAVRGAATTLTWSATAQSARRVNPYASNTTAAAIPAANSAPSGFGWRLRTTDVNAVEPRVVAAGTWTFALAISTGSYALLAGNPNYTLTAIVFKYDAAGVATEVFRASSAATGYAATSDVTMTATASRPSFTLLQNETIQVEWYVTSAATANALGAVTNNVVTVRTEVSYTDLGAPLRTVATRTASDLSLATMDTTSRVTADFRRNSEVVSLIAENTQRIASLVRRTAETTTLTDSTARVVAAVRRGAESILLTDSTIRTGGSFRRSSDLLVVITDTLQRIVTASRSLTEPVALTDTTARQANFPRQIGETVLRPTDTTSRLYTAARPTTASVPRPVDVSSRFFIAARSPIEPMSLVTDVAIKLVTYGRTVRYRFQPGDDPLIDVTKAIAGIVRTSDGAIYTGGATVVLYRADTNIGVQVQISGPDGSYSFPRNSYDTNRYYVAAFITSPMPQQAVTERILLPS